MMQYFILIDPDFDVLFCDEGPEEINGESYCPVCFSFDDALQVGMMLTGDLPYVPKQIRDEEIEHYICMAANVGAKYVGFVKGFENGKISLSLQRISREIINRE